MRDYLFTYKKELFPSGAFQDTSDTSDTLPGLRGTTAPQNVWQCVGRPVGTLLDKNSVLGI